MTTDTQREPKPGEWWEIQDGDVVLVLCQQEGARAYEALSKRCGSAYVNQATFVRFLGKTVDLTPPAPPAKKLRAWKPQDVPWLALYRADGATEPVRINAVYRDSISVSGWTVSFEQLRYRWQHSTDSGRTWQPCGVEE